MYLTPRLKILQNITGLIYDAQLSVIDCGGGEPRRLEPLGDEKLPFSMYDINCNRPKWIRFFIKNIK